MQFRPAIKSQFALGFTLIELSIVLVIIGLIIGGVLVGRDLISAARVRAQISQIQKYQVAVHAFQAKYGYLPGDIPDPAATNYGFQTRGTFSGEGDGDNVLEGVFFNGDGDNKGTWEAIGETAVFWVDLSTANLIDAGFNTASTTANPPIVPVTGAGISSYFPYAKLGRGNYVYVYSGTSTGECSFHACTAGTAYYGISAVTSLGTGSFLANPAMTVAEANAIDQKIDDDLPQSGSVLAMYLGFSNANIVGATGAGTQGPPGTGQTAPTATTCYDNGNVNGAQQHYSIEVGGGANINCALSLQFQ